MCYPTPREKKRKNIYNTGYDMINREKSGVFKIMNDLCIINLGV